MVSTTQHVERPGGTGRHPHDAGRGPVVVGGGDPVVWVQDKLVRLYDLPGPVAVTDEVWADVVTGPPAPPAGRTGRVGGHPETEGERLFNLLCALITTDHRGLVAVRRQFTVRRVPGDRGRHRRPVRLTATAAVNGRSEPVTLVDYAATGSATSRRWFHRRAGAR